VRGSFLGTRSFGTDPAVVARRACAFAAGLRAGGVGATLKHFPGLGRAVGNTDDGRIAITASAARIRSDWAPYDGCAARDRTLVMMSSATYPALLASGAPAVLDPATYARELPRAGVPAATPTISDDLDAGAIAGRDHPARRALRAGLDLLLFASAEGSAQAYRGLLADARAGTIAEPRVRDAAAAVLALKAALRP
jgi:beta-N-acetylhexosaminidase